MKQLNRLILAVSAGLAAALIPSLPGLAFAQDAEGFEADNGEWSEDYDCTDEEDCDEAYVDDESDDAGHVRPPPGTTAEDWSPSSDEAEGEPELVTPGSTEESNPGGSTRPGTTPDN